VGGTAAEGQTAPQNTVFLYVQRTTRKISQQRVRTIARVSNHKPTTFVRHVLGDLIESVLLYRFRFSHCLVFLDVDVPNAGESTTEIRELGCV
jgi:hypothetical protein